MPRTIDVPGDVAGVIVAWGTDLSADELLEAARGVLMSARHKLALTDANPKPGIALVAALERGCAETREVLHAPVHPDPIARFGQGQYATDLGEDFVLRPAPCGRGGV